MYGFLFFVILILVFLRYYRKDHYRPLRRVSGTYTGMNSEKALVHHLLKMGIPESLVFHDLYLKKENGKYSQSDVIAITHVGIIVFEVKDYSGWLFGRGHQQQWTQVLNYGKEKHRFYNPILQNNTHIEEWKRKYPEFQNIPFFSVIVFYGNCELKEITDVPANCYVANELALNDVMNRIFTQNTPIEIPHIENICAHFLEAVANGNNSEIRQQHIRNIQEMMSKERMYN